MKNIKTLIEQMIFDNEVVDIEWLDDSDNLEESVIKYVKNHYESL